VAPHPDVKVAVSPPAPTIVTYTLPTAADEQGGVLAVTCLPASGSTFGVGSTTVTCTATNAGHTGANRKPAELGLQPTGLDIRWNAPDRYAAGVLTGNAGGCQLEDGRHRRCRGQT